MKKPIVQITIAYSYHAVFIVLACVMMRHYADGMLAYSAIGSILYLGYWIITNAKGYMPWIVYVHFLIGSAIEIILNAFEIIPGDSGMFANLGQGIYVIVVLFYAVLIGVTNLILWLIDKKRKRS